MFTIDDTGAAPFTVPSASLTASRKRVPSFKNRLLLLSPPDSIDLPAAVRDGIQGNIEYLGSKSTSFALPTLRKWARHADGHEERQGLAYGIRGRASASSLVWSQSTKASCTKAVTAPRCGACTPTFSRKPRQFWDLPASAMTPQRSTVQ